jgi:5-methylthioadenosine/S-adenosylhomocysteine deaminase
MRASYAFMVRDQNRLVYEPDEQFVGRLPADLAPAMAEFFAAQTIPLDDHLALFESLRSRYADEERIAIQLAPANLHWCSDRALEMLGELSAEHDAPLHMHLVETAYQKEYARRRSGKTALGHIHDLGLLGPRMTLGHGVWLTEDDVDLAAETDTMICHNPSSNLRLRSGIAPVNRFLERGVRVALGIDEAGINDDRDLLLEMKLALRVHRVPGMDDVVPTPGQILRMATEHGALTTPFGARIGTLEPGRAADLVLMRWDQISHPYLDPRVAAVDAVVQRGRSRHVDTVLVTGEPILRDGRFTRINKEEILAELAASLDTPLRPDEDRRRVLAEAVLPHVQRFYASYLDAELREPFYQPNSRR